MFHILLLTRREKDISLIHQENTSPLMRKREDI